MKLLLAHRVFLESSSAHCLHTLTVLWPHSWCEVYCPSGARLYRGRMQNTSGIQGNAEIKSPWRRNERNGVGHEPVHYTPGVLSAKDVWLKGAIKNPIEGLPWWHSGWESACQCGGHGFEPWSGRIPLAAEQLTHAPQLLSLRSRACEPQLLSLRVATTEARMPRARAPQQEKPPQ